jgi:23S rRNA (uracil1939-C5)-methyltransferase
MITGEIKTVRSIVLNINRENTNVILGKENITIYGSDRIRDYIGDLQFLISPLSFFQVNPIQTQVLYDRAVEYASLTGKETVFDLYSGTGTISLFMAKRARKVYGIEIVEDAAEDARENARINNITNVEFIAGPVEDIIPELHKKGIKADVIVLDPPRKGCDPALLNTVIEMRPARIVYVSCNPATLARDLNILDRGGFQPLEIQPVDMFPHTSHVESVVLLKRKYSS